MEKMDNREKVQEIFEEKIHQNIDENQTSNLNNFILQNQIGYGSFGKVFKVKEKKSGCIFAAKISIQVLEENSYDAITNISREINIISKLNHPFVLKFIGYSPFNFKKSQNQ